MPQRWTWWWKPFSCTHRPRRIAYSAYGHRERSDGRSRFHLVAIFGADRDTSHTPMTTAQVGEGVTFASKALAVVREGDVEGGRREQPDTACARRSRARSPLSRSASRGCSGNAPPRSKPSTMRASGPDHLPQELRHDRQPSRERAVRGGVGETQHGVAALVVHVHVRHPGAHALVLHAPALPRIVFLPVYEAADGCRRRRPPRRARSRRGLRVRSGAPSRGAKPRRALLGCEGPEDPSHPRRRRRPVPSAAARGPRSVSSVGAPPRRILRRA